MNRKYLNYGIFIALVLIVIGIAVNHSRYIRSQIDAMIGPNKAAAIAAAKSLVESQQFSDTISGEPKDTRIAVIQALEDWAQQPPPPATAQSSSSASSSSDQPLTPADAVTQIVAFLKDQDKPVRDRAIVGLLRVGALSKANLDNVITGMEDTDANTSKGCVLALQILGQTNAHNAVRLIPLETVDILHSLGAISYSSQSNQGAMAAAQYILSLRNPQVVSMIIPEIVAKMVTDTAARSPGGDVLSSYTDQSAQCVQALTPLLNNSDDTVKEGAADALGKVGSKMAIPYLMPLLKENADVRKAAIAGIALIANKSGEAPLIEAMNDPTVDHDVREQAAVGLGKIGTPEAIAALVKALRDYDLKIQESATDALAVAGKPAIPTLLGLLKSPDTNLQYRSAQALARIALPEANAGLIAAMKDKDHRVAIQACIALGFQGNTSAVQPLIAELANTVLGQSAANSLAMIGAASQPALMKSLSSPNDVVAYYASQSLGQQGESVVPLITDAAKGSPAARPWVAITLGEIGGKNAITALEDMRKYKGGFLQNDISIALNKIGVTD